MNIQHILIGLFFTFSALSGASSYETQAEAFRSSMQPGSLLDQFITQPEELEAGFGTDVMYCQNIDLPAEQMPTKEQLLRRINFCNEVNKRPDLIPALLMWACARNAPISCSLILSCGFSPNINFLGFFDFPITPLCLATLNKNPLMIKKLCALGANVDYPCISGEVPLHFAARTGDEFTLMQLLAYGANPNAVGTDGVSPLHIATDYNLARTIRILLCYDADPNLKTYAGTPAICIAAACPTTDSLEALIEGKAEIHASTADGRTALHVAAQLGHLEHAQLLLEKGADVSAKTKYPVHP